MKNIKIIKREPLDRTDIIVLVVHFLILFAMWASYKQELVPPENLKDFISAYFFLLPLLLIGLFFRKLRNFNFYIVWLMIAFTQLFIYPELNDLKEFQFYRGSAFTGLGSLLPTLIMFQILRVIFMKMYSLEMIISIRHYRRTRWEEEENRNMTWLEVSFSILLMFTAIFSNIYG